MTRTGTTTTVAALPDCQFCKDKAEYDFRTRYGAWAYGCERDWITYRESPRLGTGMAQHLVVEGEAEVDTPAEEIAQVIDEGEPVEFGERRGDPQDRLHRERERNNGPEVPDVLKGLVWKASDQT